MGERKHNKTGRKKEEVVKLWGADPNESDDVPLQDIQHIYDFFIINNAWFWKEEWFKGVVHPKMTLRPSKM